MTEEEILAAADVILKKRMEPLADLWDKTKMDWHLHMGVSLTEPTCPVASITPEDGERGEFTYFGNGPIEAILKSIDAARAALEKKND